MSEKVYCRDCKFYMRRATWDFFVDYCRHPSNYKDSYYRPNDEELLKPGDFNQNNDCSNFEESVSIPWYKKLFGRSQ